MSSDDDTTTPQQVPEPGIPVDGAQAQSAAPATGEQPPQPQKQKLTPHRLREDARLGQIYRIWLLNIFLQIVTLGIYSFWGKTRLRKYLYGSVTLDGDRFDYTGQGGELFFGFLKAAPLLLVMIAPFIMGEFYGEDEELPVWLAIWTIIGAIMIFWFVHLAVYMAHRYRLSRTRWRGIRGRLTGSAFKYSLVAIGLGFLNMLTLFLMSPVVTLKKHAHIMDNMWFGNQRAVYLGRAGNLYGSFLLSMPVTFLLMLPGIAALVAPFFFLDGGVDRMIETLGAPMPEGEQFISKADGGELPEGPFANIMMVALYLGGIVWCIGAVRYGRSWYQAAVMREKMRGLTVAGLRFRSLATGGKLLKLKLGNLLIFICTLSLGRPLIIHRNLRFVANNTVIYGDVAGERFKQGERGQGSGIGEGLDDMLDVDSSMFDLGF